MIGHLQEDTYCTAAAELKSANPGRCEESVVKLDRAYMEFGRPGGRKSGLYHVGHRLNIEWLDCGDVRISETRMSPLVPDACREDGARWTDVNKPCSHVNIILLTCRISPGGQASGLCVNGDNLPAMPVTYCNVVGI